MICQSKMFQWWLLHGVYFTTRLKYKVMHLIVIGCLMSNKETNELQQAIQDNDTKNTFTNIRNALAKYFIENPL